MSRGNHEKPKSALEWIQAWRQQLEAGIDGDPLVRKRELAILDELAKKRYGAQKLVTVDAQEIAKEVNAFAKSAEEHDWPEYTEALFVVAMTNRLLTLGVDARLSDHQKDIVRKERKGSQ